MSIIKFEEIDSTNKYLLENYNSLDDLTVCVAEYQTQGKGRMDRVWTANKGENLTFSILLKDVQNTNPAILTLLAGVSVAKVLEELGLAIKIKWPNDIYVNSKKICGILAQGVFEDNRQHIVIGIGLNVNQVTFIGEYRKSPTSIKNETNKEYNIYDILDMIYNKFITLYINQTGTVDDVISYLNNNLYGLDKKVIYNNKTYIIKRVNNDGSLKLFNNSEEVDIYSNEIYVIE